MSAAPKVYCDGVLVTAVPADGFWACGACGKRLRVAAHPPAKAAA